MRALQTNLGAVPATVFLNKENKAVLFVKHGNNNFIDYTNGNDMAAWTKDSLCIGPKEYKYNTWTIVEDSPELKDYFREVLREQLQDI